MAPYSVQTKEHSYFPIPNRELSAENFSWERGGECVMAAPWVTLKIGEKGTTRERQGWKWKLISRPDFSKVNSNNSELAVQWWREIRKLDDFDNPGLTLMTSRKYLTIQNYKKTIVMKKGLERCRMDSEDQYALLIVTEDPVKSTHVVFTRHVAYETEWQKRDVSDSWLSYRPVTR